MKEPFIHTVTLFHAVTESNVLKWKKRVLEGVFLSTKRAETISSNERVFVNANVLIVPYEAVGELAVSVGDIIVSGSVPESIADGKSTNALKSAYGDRAFSVKSVTPNIFPSSRVSNYTISDV